MSVDLSTNYLGIRLRSPLVASASPLTAKLESLQKLEQAGAAAAVLPSLFEEQIEHEEQQLAKLHDYHAESFAESLSYFPEQEDYRVGADDYLRLIQDAKKRLAIPIIGSLNGSSTGGWTRYAKAIEEAGADALELNIYFVPTEPLMTAQDVEQQYVELVETVRSGVSIPLSVKIGPNFSSLPNFAVRLTAAGASGLVLFNRYLEPDIDLDQLQAVPHLVLSQRSELRAPLRWIAILREHINGSLAATSGVHQAEDAIKLLLAGADVTMMASVLLAHGVARIGQIQNDIAAWLEEKEYDSIEQMKGSMSRANCPDPGALERGNYMKALASYTSEHTA